MKKWVFLLFLPLAFIASPSDQYEPNIPLIERSLSEAHARSRAVSMADLSQLQRKGVSAVEVSDYVYGNYRGDFPSPPHADLNPRRAFIIQWEHFPYQFVFSHEAIELIGLCPVGKRWSEVLQKVNACQERHALAVLDPFSIRRYDVFWTPKSGTLWDSTHRRVGNLETWMRLDDSEGVIFAMPLMEGMVFCEFGDASGFRHDYTRIKEHTFKDTGYTAWGSSSGDHGPIGWVNSQGHVVDGNSFLQYPNCFATVGMDFFALPDKESARGVYYSLLGVGAGDGENIRRTVRTWLEKGEKEAANPELLCPFSFDGALRKLVQV